jgi:hypothetical protein
LLGGLKRRPGLKRGEEDWPRGCAGAVGGVISTDSGWKAAETQRQECRCHARGACVVSGADVVGAPLPRWGKSETGSGSTGCAMLRAASLHPSLHSGAPLGRRWCGVGGGSNMDMSMVVSSTPSVWRVVVWACRGCRRKASSTPRLLTISPSGCEEGNGKKAIGHRP